MVVFLFLLVVSELMPLKYTDPLNRLPTEYPQYIEKQNLQPFMARRLSGEVGRDSNLVAIIVNDSLYPLIENSLNQYLSDLSSEGFCTVVYRSIGGTPQDLRNVLIGELPHDLVGAVMVGDLPIAWWEGGYYQENCPVDLYFSDLDGYWNDVDQNGIFDQHSSGSGDPQPEIWIGRLYCSQLTYGNQANLLNSYFQRNRQYRTGNLSLPYRGLVYNEVQFYPNDHGMDNLFSNVTMINDENTTNAFDYKQRLLDGYHFMFLGAHSSCWAHTFFLQGDVFGGGSVFNFEIPFVDPHVFFYFLNCCMAGRFTETDNLANWYLFSPSYSLAVITSSELMYGINSLSGFFQDLDNQLTLGESFKNWHSSNYSMFTGTLILGDPSLKITNNFKLQTEILDPVYSHILNSSWVEYPVESSSFVNGHPSAAIADSKLWLFWDSGRIVRGDIFGCFYNQGNFSQPESIAWHEYYDFYASAVEDSEGRLWVAWQSFRDYSGYYTHFNIYTSYLYNGTWSSPQHVQPLADWHDLQPCLGAGSDDRVWVGFKSFRNGNADIYCSYAQGGGSWSNSTAITSTPQDETDPVVVVDLNNEVWLFWTRSEQGFYQIFGDHYDGSWHGNFQITSGQFDHCRPKAVVGGDGKIWLVWHSWINGQGEIFYCFRDSTGWSTPQAITANQGNDIKPVITVDQENKVWVAWMSDREGDYDIFYSNYSNGWSVPQNITSNQNNDIDPDIASLNNDIWVIWATDRNNYWNIYAAMTSINEIEESPVEIETPQDISLEYQVGNNLLSFNAPVPYQMEIFSVDGRLIDRENSSRVNFCWQISDLSPGMYFVLVKTKSQCKYFKFLYIN